MHNYFNKAILFWKENYEWKDNGVFVAQFCHSQLSEWVSFFCVYFEELKGVSYNR